MKQTQHCSKCGWAGHNSRTCGQMHDPTVPVTHTNARERELKELEDELWRTVQELRENYKKLGVALGRLEQRWLRAGTPDA